MNLELYLYGAAISFAACLAAVAVQDRREAFDPGRAGDIVIVTIAWPVFAAALAMVGIMLTVTFVVDKLRALLDRSGRP